MFCRVDCTLFARTRQSEVRAQHGEPKKITQKGTCDKAGTLSLSKNIVIGQDANEL